MRNNKANSLISFEFIKSASPMKTIFWSGLVAGILDAIAGVIVYYIFFGLNPLQVLQFIAAGVYGPGAINGGVGMILAGTFYHFLIAGFPVISVNGPNMVIISLIMHNTNM